MLELRSLSVCLDGRQILQNITFTLRPQRLTVLLGRNGSGKSTLLSGISRQLPHTGQVLWEGRDMKTFTPKQRARRLAYLPQALPAPPVTVAEMAAFGRNPYLDLTGRLTAQDWAVIDAALAQVGVEDLFHRRVDTLSGGECQRAALAMILAQDTPLALLDEPTAHLDPACQAEFLQLLRSLTESQGKAFLTVLHDPALAVAWADDILVLDKGTLVFAGSKEACLEQAVLEKTFCLERYTFPEKNGERIFFSPRATR